MSKIETITVGNETYELPNKTFNGTHAEWNDLATEQKTAYDFVVFTDDYDEELDDTTTSASKVWSSNKVNTELSARDKLGAKNLLPNNAVSQTINGVTFTVNTDGSVTANGTATGSINLEIGNITPSLVGTSLKMSDESTSTGVYMFISYILNGSTQYITDKTFTIPNNSIDIKVYIHVNSNYSGNVTVYPMIRLASITDDTYQPYAETNLQLTQNKLSQSDYAESGAVNFAPNNISSQVLNGVTFTVNSDGSVTASNNSASANIRLVLGTIILKAGVTYRINDNQNGTYSEIATHGCFVRRKSDSYWLLSTANNNIPSILTPTTDEEVEIGIFINSGNNANRTIYPMLCLDSYKGTYVPYAKTNAELTEGVDTLSSGVTSINNALADAPKTIIRQAPTGNVVFSIPLAQMSNYAQFNIIIWGNNNNVGVYSIIKARLNSNKTAFGGSGIINLDDSTPTISTMIDGSNAKISVTGMPTYAALCIEYFDNSKRQNTWSVSVS